MSRVLCPECLQSVEEAQSVDLGGKRLCPACLPLVRKRADLERLAPAFEPSRPSLLRRLHAEALSWCRGRWWALRLPLLVWMGVILWGRVLDPLHGGSWWWYALDLGIHELGHYVFRPLGMFLGVLGGSLLQCLVPVLSMGMFWRQRDFFAIAICFGWLSENLFDVATYAADARAQRLPLITPGGGGGHPITHDWHYLLEKTGLLAQDALVAGGLRVCATAAMLVCLGFGSWLLFRMLRPLIPSIPPPPGGWPQGETGDDRDDWI